MRLVLKEIQANYRPENEIYNFTSVNKNKQFTSNGIYSEKIYGNMYGSKEAYECDCKAISGEHNLGIICSICNSPVVRKESKVLDQGWIDLGMHQLINPVYITFMQKFFGKNRLARYLSPEYIRVDSNGMEYVDESVLPKSETFPQFVSLGVKTFIENFDVILEEFKCGTKNYNVSAYEFLKENRKLLFTSKIPIFTHRLRPAVMVGDQMIFDKVNSIFTQMVKGAGTLNALSLDGIPLNVDHQLFKLQCLYMQHHDYVVSAVIGKDGEIRSRLLGNRFNFTSRCVITPLPHFTKFNEVHVPYIVMVELLKLTIINYLVQYKGLSYSKANDKWFKASLSFNQEMYEYILDIEKIVGGFKGLINRNPSLSLGSILTVDLKVKSSSNDLTMSVPNNLLALLNGDFDGDVLSIFMLNLKKHKKYFEKFKPQYLTISPNDGRLNKRVTLKKDHALGISTLLH